MTPPLLVPGSPPAGDAGFHLAHLRRRHILADDLPAEIHKGLVHIRAAPRARLVIRRVAPVLADGEGARAGDGAVFFQIGFVAYDDEGDARIVLDPNDLVAEFVEFGEGGEGGYGKD